MKIGFELETILECQPCNGIGEYHSGESVDELPTIAGRSFLAEHDSSICNGSDEYACEFVSPKFAFNSDNILKMKTALDIIHDDFGARVNRSCGTHISVSMPSMNHREFRQFYYLARMFQQGFYASTGSITRQENSYAEPIRNLPYCGETGVDEGCYSRNTHRTSWLNTTNIDKTNKVTGRNDRCEFRIFSGTLEPKKLIAWSQLATCFSLWASDTELQTNPVVPYLNDTQYGEGRFQLDCLLDTLGWLDNTNNNWVENDVLSIKDGVNVLQTLADKYDAKMYDERQGYIL